MRAATVAMSGECVAAAQSHDCAFGTKPCARTAAVATADCERRASDSFPEFARSAPAIELVLLCAFHFIYPSARLIFCYSPQVISSCTQRLFAQVFILVVTLRIITSTSHSVSFRSASLSQ